MTDRLHELLVGSGVSFDLMDCDPALADTAEFCAAYGYALDDSANTIVVVGKTDPPVYESPRV